MLAEDIFQRAREESGILVGGTITRVRPDLSGYEMTGFADG